jgi:Reverse transcriptase (RNA-dependent DNA polymerase)/Integrase zinc binding domain/RNase H-like domain found in reverse transcriptase/Chromo (CHRromatin Organisation MOdifier) domain/Aspartyl protease
MQTTRVRELEDNLKLKLTVDAFAVPTRPVCERHYTEEQFMRMTLWDHPTPGKPEPDKEVIWCQAPLHNAIPYIRHTQKQVQNSRGAIGLVVYPHWPNTPAHKMLQTWEKVHTYPAGTDLFDVPAQVKGKPRTQHGVYIERGRNTRGPRPQPAKPTLWPVHVYKIMAHPQADPSTEVEELPTITEATHAQAGRNNTQQPYIFKARVTTTRSCVSVRTGGKYSVLNEEQTAAVKAHPEKLPDIAVLGDTGATHSLIPLRVANQLGLTMDANRRGSVILGDGHSGVPILGQCLVPIKIGKYACTVLALIIDVDWGPTQHLVLGSDWIAEHRAMLGAGEGKGPQLDIRGPTGTENHTIFARKVLKRSQWELPEKLENLVISAPQFAAMLERRHDLTGNGSAWDAVDFRTENGKTYVQFYGEEPVPLETFMDAEQWFRYSCMNTSFQQTTTAPQPTPPPPAPDEHSRAKYHNQDLSRDTPAGIPAETVAGWRDRFPEVFKEDLPNRSMSDHLSPRPETVHTIPLLPNAKPVFRRQRRLSPAERKEVEKQLKYHIEKGLVQPSSSPWGAPILFTPKPDGTLRMCVDYRGLNAVTERDVFPLPRGEDLYQRVKGKKVFSSIDLLKGYWQVAIQPRDRHLTAFTTPEGLFEYKVLAMGLTNAPATFQRMMIDIFDDLIKRKVVMVYLDDVLIMTESIEEHCQVMEEVLTRLQRNKLIIRFDKCKFGMKELKFLGFIISGDTVHTDPAKTQAVRDWPIPTTSTVLRGFLGLANYFRKFIPDYAMIAAPLTALTGGPKKGKVTLNEKQMAAFEAIKQALVSPAVLAVDDPDKPYEVITDASCEGVGAVLIQRDDTGHPKVIAYESKAFTTKKASIEAKLTSKAQIQQPDGSISLDQAALEDASGKQELTALIHALKVWRCYLEGSPFTVYVDHNPLTYLLEKPHLNRWQVRILEVLSMYPHMKIQHIPGKLNIADGLSRIKHGPQAPATDTPSTVTEAILQCGELRFPRLSNQALKDKGERKPTKKERKKPWQEEEEPKLPLTETIAKLQCLYGNAIFAQANLTRAQARKQAAGEGSMETAQELAPTPPPAQLPTAQLPTAAIPTTDWLLEPDDEDMLPLQSGETEAILQQPNAGTWAHTFLTRCVNGYERDPEMAQLIAQQTAAPGKWVLDRGLWFNKGALVIPNHDSLRTECISQYHDPPQWGHQGPLKTKKAIERFYWWPTLGTDVATYVHTCDSCQRMKPMRQKRPGLIQPWEIPAERLKHWVIDFAVALPRTDGGYDSILVMVDRKTRYTILRPCPANCTAAQAIRILMEATHIFGPPLSIICDPDSKFKGEFHTHLEGLGCKVHVGSVDHHETVGLAERTIQSVKGHLRHYINATQTNWADLLPPLQSALNNGYCDAIHTTPNYLALGMHPDQPNLPTPTPPDDHTLRAQWQKVEREAAERLEATRQRMLVTANAKRRDVQFNVGDEVLLSTKHPWFQNTADGVRKLIPAWTGPHTITRVNSKVTYTLALPEEIKCDNVFHVHLLKAYHPDTRRPSPPPTTLIEGHEQFEVEAVINHRIKKLRSGPKEEYKVAFVGYGPHYNKWLPLENLEGCPEAIVDYHARRHAGVGARAVAQRKA